MGVAMLQSTCFTLPTVYIFCSQEIQFRKSKESMLLGAGAVAGVRTGATQISGFLPAPPHEAVTTQPEEPVAKESSVPPPTVLNQAHVKLVPSSVQVSSLEPQDLPWERLLTWSALALLLLSFLAVYYGNGEVVCNSPAHLSSSFVNSACQQSLSHWSYYPLIVFLQSCVLLLPQYLWYSYSKWHVQFFFGALQRFNRHPFTDEGECELEAFQVVANLEDRFAKSRYLARQYHRKMLLQLGIWTVCCAAAILVTFSGHSSTKFKCPTSILPAKQCPSTDNCKQSDQPPFIDCFHSSQLHNLNTAWVSILLVILVGIVYSFGFLFHFESVKNSNDVKTFCADSHFNPKHFMCDGYPVASTSDLEFLVVHLSHIDAGLAAVFQEVQVRMHTNHVLNKQVEVFRAMKYVQQNGYLSGEGKY